MTPRRQPERLLEQIRARVAELRWLLARWVSRHPGGNLAA
jgi:hypothetical protein